MLKTTITAGSYKVHVWQLYTVFHKKAPFFLSELSRVANTFYSQQ